MPLYRSAANIAKRRFDFVVIGAGAAGCVAAAQLAIAGAEVALIEAGPPASGFFFEAPVGAVGVVPGNVPGLRHYNWSVTAEKSLDLNERQSFFPRGRCLGGSTAINAALYVRGHPQDYEEWGAAHEGWRFKDVLPVFRELECNVRGESLAHGVRGMQLVTDPPTTLVNGPLNIAFGQACAAAGLVFNSDFNGDTTDGFGVYQRCVHGGRRQSSYNAFIEPLLGSSAAGSGASGEGLNNLHVISHCHADRVLFGPLAERTKATGVRTIRVGDDGGADLRSEAIELHAVKGVIASLGTLHTPALLQRSGIGDASHGGSLGIDPVLDNPQVGANLIDHLNVTLTHKISSDTVRTKSLSLRNLRYLYQQLREYQEEGTGILTSVTEMGAFVRSSNDVPRPDIQLHFQHFPVFDHARKLTFFDGYSLAAAALYPKSRGSVRIATRDPLRNPRVVTNFLRHEDDVAVMEQAVVWAQLLSSPLSDLQVPEIETGRMINPWQYMNSTLVGARSGLATREERIKFVRETADGFYHPVGTCAMGAVVDNRLAVLGAQNLFVADASVIPRPLGGNTAAPSQMIGAQLAHFLAGTKPAVPVPTPVTPPAAAAHAAAS